MANNYVKLTAIKPRVYFGEPPGGGLLESEVYLDFETHPMLTPVKNFGMDLTLVESFNSGKEGVIYVKESVSQILRELNAIERNTKDLEAHIFWKNKPKN